MEIAEYELVEHYLWSKFHEHVNGLIKAGWVPQGGVALAFNDGGSIKGYAQAMVRYKKEAE